MSDFPEDVVTYITSPKTGLQRRMKWPPTISEVLEACEQHQDFLMRARTSKPVSKRLPPQIVDHSPGAIANLFIPEDHARYPSLLEWTKGADRKWWKIGQSSDGRKGIWIPMTLWEGRDPTKLEEPRR